MGLRPRTPRKRSLDKMKHIITDKKIDSSLAKMSRSFMGSESKFDK
jgi:hypothetical protein